MVNAGLLYYFLQKRGIYRFEAHWKKLLAQFIFANIIMIAVLWYSIGYFPSNAGQWERVIALTIICILGVFAYLIALFATGFRPRQLKHN